MEPVTFRDEIDYLSSQIIDAREAGNLELAAWHEARLRRYADVWNAFAAVYGETPVVIGDVVAVADVDPWNEAA